MILGNILSHEQSIDHSRCHTQMLSLCTPPEKASLGVDIFTHANELLEESMKFLSRPWFLDPFFWFIRLRDRVAGLTGSPG